MKFKYLIAASATFLLLVSAGADAQVSGQGATWTLKDSSLSLAVYTDPTDPVKTRSIVLALSYRKADTGRCLPVVALLVFQSVNLGRFENRKIYSTAKDRLVVTVGGTKFTAQGDTVANTYDNGFELVSYFSPELNQSFFSPTTIILSSESFGKIAEFSTTNGIGENYADLVTKCESEQ